MDSAAEFVAALYFVGGRWVGGDSRLRRTSGLVSAHEHHGGTSALGRLVYVFVLGGQWMLQAFDLDLANCGAQYWPGQTGRRRLVLPVGGRGLLALQLMVEQVLAMNC